MRTSMERGAANWQIISRTQALSRSHLTIAQTLFWILTGDRATVGQLGDRIQLTSAALRYQVTNGESCKRAVRPIAPFELTAAPLPPAQLAHLSDHGVGLEHLPVLGEEQWAPFCALIKLYSERWHISRGVPQEEAANSANVDFVRLCSWLLETNPALNLDAGVREYVLNLAQATAAADHAWGAAQTSLLNVLASGCIVAIGRLNGMDHPSLIERVFWPTACFIDRHIAGRGWQACAVQQATPYSGNCYCDLRFDAGDVFAALPILERAPNQPARRRLPLLAAPDQTPGIKIGRKPAVRERVKAEMRSEIQSGRTTVEKLSGTKQEALAGQYGASRETVVTARRELAREFAGKAFPTA